MKQYARKNFRVPGMRKIIRLQGFEPFCISDLMLKEAISFSKIRYEKKQIPPISYMFQGRLRRYYPDFFIPSQRRIIEVKSWYTWKINEQVNLAKRQACLQAGWSYEIRIYNHKGTLLSTM